LDVTIHTTLKNNSDQGKVMSIDNPTMDLHGTIMIPSIAMHGGIKTINGDIKITQNQEDAGGATINKIKVTRNNWIPCLNFSRTDRC